MMEVIKGSNLKLLLKKKGITQKYLSESLGVHMTTISRYFTDDVAMPATFVLRVAVLADFQIEDLVKYNKSEKLILVANESQTDYIRKEIAEKPIALDDLGKIIRDMQTKIIELQKEVKELKKMEIMAV